jgi:hypothetical protein
MTVAITRREILFIRRRKKRPGFFRVKAKRLAPNIRPYFNRSSIAALISD